MQSSVCAPPSLPCQFVLHCQVTSPVTIDLAVIPFSISSSIFIPRVLRASLLFLHLQHALFRHQKAKAKRFSDACHGIGSEQPAHEPAPQQEQSSRFLSSRSVIFPFWRAPTASNNDITSRAHHLRFLASWPPVTTMVGISRRPAAMRCPARSYRMLVSLPFHRTDALPP